MPLLTELSDWRVKMNEIERQLQEENQEYDLTFVADFNGLKLENYISHSLNASIEVLNGEINVEMESPSLDWDVERSVDDKFSTSHAVKKFNRTLKSGQKLQVVFV